MVPPSKLMLIWMWRMTEQAYNCGSAVMQDKLMNRNNKEPDSLAISLDGQSPYMRMIMIFEANPYMRMIMIFDSSMMFKSLPVQDGYKKCGSAMNILSTRKTYGRKMHLASAGKYFNSVGHTGKAVSLIFSFFLQYTAFVNFGGCLLPGFDIKTKTEEVDMDLPKCDSLGCSDVFCCPGKQSWPELVGMRAQDAKTIIECENPNVRVVIATREMYRIPDLCCNIVWIYVDDLVNGVVTSAPVVG